MSTPIVSPRCWQFLGCRPEEIIGKTPFDLMLAAEGKRVSRIYQHTISEAAPINALENVNHHRDGREVILETSGVPFFDDKGSLAGYRGIDRDITERKRGELRLRESEARYRAVFDQQFQFMAILSPDGTTLDINELPLKMIGCKREDFVGKRFGILLPGGGCRNGRKYGKSD
ncbi:MAG: PAS domain S-box protein [Gammaproteobacteria bacterium]|nr:PAS domain S-box protein [Gammaproteobacteria bacterium]